MTTLVHPHPAPGRGRRSRGDALLAHATLLEERAAPALLRWTAVAVLALVLAFLAWAALAPLSELVRAEGEVEARVPLQRVQHLEGGIVAELLVTDGQQVRADEPILRLDTRALMAEHAQLQVRARALALDLERLEALLSGRPPRFDAVDGATPAMLAAQTALFEGQRSAEATRRSVLDSQIATARAGIVNLDRLLGDARLRLAMVEEERGMRRDLARTGVHSRMHVIEVDLRHSSAESEVRRLEGEGERLARSIAETGQRLAELAAHSRADHLSQRAVALREAAELQEAMARLEDRITRTVVRAPTAGVVLVAFAGTVGGVIAPGADVARIAPDGTTMRIRARIAPGDIGMVAAGDTVRLRFPAFDFAQLAPLAGRVEAILPGLAADATGRPHYTAFIRLEEDSTLGGAGLQLLPGMAAQVDIVVGDRTLLDYLFRPLRHMRERLFTQP
ncbi:HlyD family type I secretion periplasmic adaptor subunit [Rhodobaculum claviforme]|uniref:Membrane fusion protein (MFP) family protein n=1 Tax=Rhodobaculum claviforme TaxID=1549854 RepID=A0A934WHQ9_9RHOB|nr:HlyD family type I secretion periplasmic adaptor subunit [Rhodobaculum claviforme]MBK5926099.1 hypothetical protein [Rhodobaculum claviforme]